ncbi:MAG: hypothetical protein OXK16_04815 [bacterium]|nr:hypothetical protein [bacterium]
MVKNTRPAPGAGRLPVVGSGPARPAEHPWRNHTERPDGMRVNVVVTR